MHPMTRWDDNKRLFSYIGRLGDVIDFSRLHPQLRTAGMAVASGAVISDAGHSDTLHLSFVHDCVAALMLLPTILLPTMQGAADGMLL